MFYCMMNFDLEPCMMNFDLAIVMYGDASFKYTLVKSCITMGSV